MTMPVGRIICAVGGLYSVEFSDGIVVSGCTARGIFRKNNISPCAGDFVNLSDDNVISEILPRKNHIVRPPLSNLDSLVFVVSMCRPEPNLLILDKFLAVCEYKEITPIIVLTKLDLRSDDKLEELYTKTGIKVLRVDYNKSETIEAVRAELNGKFSALTGNSGVGKSTLLNALEPELSLSTAEISEKLGRGRHTTRQVSMFHLKGGGWLADTPGFSTFETNRYDIIRKNELAACFPEFSDYIGKCRFNDCAHLSETGCAVIDAVNTGAIPSSRHESYCRMYKEASELREWALPPTEQ